MIDFILNDEPIDYYLNAETDTPDNLRLLENTFPNDPDNVYRLLEDGYRRLLE